MLISRRILLSLGLLLAAHTASAQAPAVAPQFRLTVWTIRPVPKEMPSFEELRKSGSPWCFLQGFDRDQISITTDSKILEALQKANPLLSIPTFEQKKVVTVSADTPTAALLADGASVKITVKVKDREAAYAEITRTHGTAIANLYRRLPSQEMILFKEIVLPKQDVTFHPTGQMSRSKGYSSAKLNLIYAEDPTLAYSSTLVRAGENGAPSEYKTAQLPRDIVLYCLEPLPTKGDGK